MKYFYRNVCFILSVWIFLFIGCGTETDKATMLSESGRSLLDNFIYALGNRDWAKEKVDETEKKIYYTYRSGMLESVWSELSGSLPIWGYIKGKKISLWKDKLRPENEVELPTHIPWLISDYNSTLNEIKIIPPETKVIRGDPYKNEVSDPKWEDTFGDIPPFSLIKSEGTLIGSTWISKPDVLTIKLEKNATDFIIDKLKSDVDVKLKVYYKIKAIYCYVVKVEIFDKSGKLLLETKLDTNIPERIIRLTEEIYRSL